MRISDCLARALPLVASLAIVANAAPFASRSAPAQSVAPAPSSQAVAAVASQPPAAPSSQPPAAPSSQAPAAPSNQPAAVQSDQPSVVPPSQPSTTRVITLVGAPATQSAVAPSKPQDGVAPSTPSKPVGGAGGGGAGLGVCQSPDSSGNDKGGITVTTTKETGDPKGFGGGHNEECDGIIECSPEDVD